MIQYQIQHIDTNNKWLDIEMQIDQLEAFDIFTIHLPLWRPGRYEAQNYAANIRNVVVHDDSYNEFPIKKINTNTWRIVNDGAPKITISYQYYCNQLDAGGSHISNTEWYINFVNCLFFIPQKTYQPCKVTLDIPSEWKIACGITVKENHLFAEDYFQLIDCPIYASPTIETLSYSVNDIPFYIHFAQKPSLDIDKLISDFKAFTEVQMNIFNSFPEADYHFIIYNTDYTFYHGVEHRNSTVIMLGPNQQLHQRKNYLNLLGIASHELFHTWNICKIKPKEFHPIDLTKEVRFDTGYVAEGFTTYYGDLCLIKAGVISFEEYLQELNTTLYRHSSQKGWAYSSLLESSCDLWINGYKPTAPDTKVSIYVKGSLVAMLLDLEIRRETNHQKSLDDVMRILWNDYGIANVGYSHQDIQNITEHIVGHPMLSFFKECMEGKTDLGDRLFKNLNSFGLYNARKENLSYTENYLGFIYQLHHHQCIITYVCPDTIGYKYFQMGDKIKMINNFELTSETSKNDIEAILSQSDNVIKFEIVRQSKVIKIDLYNKRETTYAASMIKPYDSLTDEISSNRSKWLN